MSLIDRLYLLFVPIRDKTIRPYLENAESEQVERSKSSSTPSAGHQQVFPSDPGSSSQQPQSPDGQSSRASRFNVGKQEASDSSESQGDYTG
jgi:hypothetical protein